MKVMLLRDDKPGHFNQSEGVVAALQRLAKVGVTRLDVVSQPLFPTRVMRGLVAAGAAGKIVENLSRIPYPPEEYQPDLIVSAGGRTLLANVLLARRLNTPNIFSGSVRGLPEAMFTAILHINPAFDSRPRYIVGLKPSAIDPDAFAAPATTRTQETETVSLLIGGDTASHPFTSGEIEILAEAIETSALSWKIATSRRTPTEWTTRLRRLAHANPSRFTLLDFTKSGPGGLQNLLATSDMALVTADSASMISEAVAFRIPVIALEPKQAGRPSADQPYLDLLCRNGWARPLGITDISDEQLSIQAALCTPMRENHLDLLAERLKNALPGLFSN